MADAVLEGVALREYAETEDESLDVEGLDISDMTYSASPDEEPPAPAAEPQPEESNPA